jgi:hypothetical protein
MRKITIIVLAIALVSALGIIFFNSAKHPSINNEGIIEPASIVKTP